MKELESKDAIEFWEYFTEKHSALRKKFPVSVGPNVINGSIIIFKPANMTIEDYKKYETIRNQWLSDKGFI